jgi:hypothetical protein
VEVNGYKIEPGANLEGAYLSGANLTAVSFDEYGYTIEPSADLSSANRGWCEIRRHTLHHHYLGYGGVTTEGMMAAESVVSVYSH